MTNDSCQQGERIHLDLQASGSAGKRIFRGIAHRRVWHGPTSLQLSTCSAMGADTWSMQVPSFDSKVAMTMIEQELGRPWQQVYSQLTPRPIAAASLGQVCIPPCHHTGGPCIHLAQFRWLQLTIATLIVV